MKLLRKKSMLLSIPLLTAIPLVVTSCASVSQYGVASTITYKAINNGEVSPQPPVTTYAEENTNTGESYPEFKNYSFLYDSPQAYKLYRDKSEVPITTSNLEFQTVFSNSILPITNILSALVKNSHIGWTSSQTNNAIFGQQNTNIDYFKEYMLASANVLNQGRKDEIKLYISDISVTENLKNQTASATTQQIDRIFPKNGDSLEVIGFAEYTPETPKEGGTTTPDPEKKYKVTQLQFKNDIELSFDFTFKYYHSGDSNAFRNSLALNDVKNYISSNNAWNGLATPTVDTFTIKSNLKVNITPVYNVKSDKIIEFNKTNDSVSGSTSGGNQGGAQQFAGESGSTPTTPTVTQGKITYSSLIDANDAKNNWIELSPASSIVQFIGMNTNASTKNDFFTKLEEGLKPSTDSGNNNGNNGDTKPEDANKPKAFDRVISNVSVFGQYYDKLIKIPVSGTSGDINRYIKENLNLFTNTIQLVSNNNQVTPSQKNK